MPTPVIDAVIQWGPPYAALAALLWGIWHAATWVGNRLFAREGGLLTEFFGALRTALDKQTTASETIIRTLGEQATAISIVERRLLDIATLHVSDDEMAHLVDLLMSDLPVPLAQVSESGMFLRTNRPLRDLLGYSAEELESMTFQDVTPFAADVAADVEQCRRLVGGVASFRMEKTFRRKDRADVYAALYVFRFPVAGRFRFFVSCLIPLHPPHSLR